MVAINYGEHKFIADLRNLFGYLVKKQIEDFEENKEEDDDDDDEEEEGEKKKGKKKVKTFRIDRGLLSNKMLKKCSVSYHMFDKATNTDVFSEGTFKGIQLVA